MFGSVRNVVLLGSLYGEGTPAGSYLGGEASGLAIDFAQDSALVRGHTTNFSGLPDNLVTYATTTPKMVYGSDGVLRFARHSLWLQSQTFDNVSWAKTRSTITANSVAAPDGTLTADTLNEDGTAANSHFVGQAITFTAGLAYKASVYVKKGTRDWIDIQFSTVAFGSTKNAYFNVNAGVIGTSQADSATIEDVGNGWWRCSAVCTATTTALANIILVVAESDGDVTFDGLSAASLYLWGAQLQLQPCHDNTYLPTTTAARFALPLDYNPVTLAALGVLVEGQRTNLFQRSQEFENGYWSTQRATVTANAAAAPDGTTTADKLIATSAAGSHRFVRSSITHGVTGEKTLTVYAKAGEYPAIRLAITDQTEGDSATCIFDLLAGTAGTPSSGGGGGTITAPIASIQAVGGGYYRCRLTATIDASEATVAAFIGVCLDATTVSYTGDDVSGIYVWGAQLEAGAFATSYIPTTSAQVTRAADSLSLATSAFPHSSAVGTLIVEASTPSSVDTSIHVLRLIGANNTIRVFALQVVAGTDGIARQGSIRNAGSANTISASAVGVNVLTKAAVSYSATELSGAFDGVSATPTVPSDAPPTTTRLDFGGAAASSAATVTGVVHIKRAMYVPRVMSAAERELRTAA